MASLAAALGTISAPSDTAKTDTRPPVRGGPVLMADCATPVAGETLLSLLWKRWDQDA